MIHSIIPLPTKIEVSQSTPNEPLPKSTVSLIDLHLRLEDSFMIGT